MKAPTNDLGALAGTAMDDVTLDTLLRKEPIKELTIEELRAAVKWSRQERAAWTLRQEKREKKDD